MVIESSISENECKISLGGCLNTQSAPEFEKCIKTNITETIKTVTLDFTGLDYISSAGLRLVLMLQNQMDDQSGTLTIQNTQKNVLDVFDMTGFSSILNLE
ncbi:MAG: STAS domain-containing protein [Clostridia bacterium]